MAETEAGLAQHALFIALPFLQATAWPLGNAPQFPDRNNAGSASSPDLCVCVASVTDANKRRTELAPELGLAPADPAIPLRENN
jgi:hypothetical protein